MLDRALQKRGFTSALVRVDGKERIEYVQPSGTTWITPTSRVAYPFNGDHLTDVSDNKSHGYEWIRQFGVSVPETLIVHPETPLDRPVIDRLLAKYQRVVVKPDDSFGSRGVSVNLTDCDHVAAAVVKAQRTRHNHATVLIQQQIQGDEYRFTVLNGKVVSVMLRETARVHGDGTRTIAELIQREDEERQTVNQTSMVRYPYIAEIIDDRSYLTSRRVLADGESFVLASSAMVSGGTSVYEIADRIHSSYKLLAQRLAEGLRAGFIVIDLFIADPGQPATTDNVFFNEFNRSPALKMYYASRNGTGVDIADALAEAIDRYLGKA